MADLVLGVAKSLVEGTLTKAQSAIEEEAKLRRSTQQDLVFIAGEFQMMQSFLSVTTEENVKNSVVSTWVTQVRDLAYDVEDCIEFVIHLDKKHDWWSRMIPSCLAPERPLDEAVDIIERLKARVEDVSQRSLRYNLISDSAPKRVADMKQLDSAGTSSIEMLHDRHKIGRKQDLDVLTKLITRKVRDLQVISVWAARGNLGAGSIISQAYDDPKIWGNFTCRAWVNVIQPFNLDEFITSLLEQFYLNSTEEKPGTVLRTHLLKRKMESAAEDYLVQEFMRHVENKTYLVVIEGVSTMVEWDAIRKYFPDTRNGSRIVVSTQQFEIASFCTGLPYFQRFSADHTLCVFFKDEDSQTHRVEHEAASRPITTEDVSKEEWDMIQDALISRPSRSVMVVITNEEKIASYCADRNDLIFNAKGLQIDAAIELFKKEVHKKNSLFPTEDIHEDAELRQLISKCGGLPKVIVAVADFLAPQSYTWTQIVKPMNARFMQDLETKQDFGCLRNLFDWMHSYFRACPDLLRPCIFYLSIFPGYSSIRRRRLVMRWVAEGFSKDTDSYTAEENAEEFFIKLVEMSMVQPPQDEISTNLKMVSCNVSAFFHEYIISRPKEENIIFALEIFSLKNFCRPTSRRTGRHLVIEDSWQRDRIVFERIDFSRLRSLTVFGKWMPFLISKSMKVLRVLDLENATGMTDKDLEQMVKLLPRLKFLSLRGSKQIFQLPSSLGDLRQLETLDVRHTSVVTLPASITKLKKLQYIRAGTNTREPRFLEYWLPHCCKPLGVVGVRVIRGTEKLTALHTLGVVNVAVLDGRAILKDFGKLTHLRKLGVSGISKKNCKVFCSIISGNDRLESLSVWLSKGNKDCLDGISAAPQNLQSLKLYGLVTKLPEWIKLVRRLTKVDLEITISDKLDISSVLGGLNDLCILRLSVKPLHSSKLDLFVRKDGAELRSFHKAGCSTGLLLRFSGVEHLTKIKEVHVIGSRDGTLKKHLEDQFYEREVKPAFKLEQVDLSNKASADKNDKLPSSRNFPTAKSSPAALLS
ncbi:hypothetical protein QOZ80_3AG0224940 [Eleusine coracana subsp. coracana]|nr:hypothetical protein QOZ80_3AG0224940 [Eleusine coracana subsp. coracana]